MWAKAPGEERYWRSKLGPFQVWLESLQAAGSVGKAWITGWAAATSSVHERA